MKFASKVVTETSTPTVTDELRYQLAHRVSGRLRYIVPALYRQKERCRYVQYALSQHPTVKSIKAQEWTGSVTVTFVEPIDYDDQFVRKLEQVLDEVQDHDVEDLTWTDINTEAVGLEQKHWWQISPEAALQELNSDAKKGLTQDEVERRLLQYGPNMMDEHQPPSKAEIWWRQIATPQTALLTGSALLSVATGGLFDVLLIGGVVAFNCVLGYLSESHAENVISSIGHLPPQSIRVIRQGKEAFIAEQQLVPGDIVVIDSGIVPADMRLIYVKRLTVDESALTGESLPANKIAEEIAETRLPIAERANMLYRGTIITSGQAIGVVVRTGIHTEIGQVRSLVKETEDQLSPMQRNLSTLGKQTVIASSLICGGVFLIGLTRGFRFVDILSTSISLAVAAVPEGLPTIGTSTLALGVQRLEKKGILARKLPVIETLGAVDVLCLDKTGTLTVNKMITKQIMMAESSYQRPFLEHGQLLNGDLQLLARTTMLCNDSYFKKEEWHGSATELAFIHLGEELGLTATQVQQEWPRVKTRYRTENKQYMVTFHKPVDSEEYFAAVKGNPTQLVDKCNCYFHEGELRELTHELRQEILTQNEEMAGNALRVLGVAFARTQDPESLSIKKLELVWLGLVGLQDPTRAGLQELIASIHDAHIRTVMMTGDQTATARAIGQELNLSENRFLKVVDAKDLFQRSDSEIDELIEGVHVFSRVSPTEKLKLVQALQRKGHIVAMTGDGINDSPALKAANVGIAMGKFGSNAARESADLILESDDLDVLYDAFEMGRSIRSNLRRSIHFLLATNLSEIMLMFGAITLGRGSPLNPIQLLWINLLTDVFPALALALEKPRTSLMQEKPIKPEEGIFSSKEKMTMLKHGTLITGISLVNFEYARHRTGSLEKANTQVFFNLTTSQTIYTLTALHQKRLKLGDFLQIGEEQRWVKWSMLLSLALILSGVRSSHVRTLLKNETLDTKDLTVGVVSSILSFMGNELMKPTEKSVGNSIQIVNS